jgi:arginase family enzyme
MNLNDYFNPVDFINNIKSYVRPDKQLFSIVVQHTKDHPIANIEHFPLAIVGVPLDDEETTKSFYAIRKQLYGLAAPDHKIKIYDLGNLKTGLSVKDTDAALRDVVIELMSFNTIPIILGASNSVIYPIYSAYQKLIQNINLVSIDNKIDVSEDRAQNTKSVLWKILVEENESLFTYSNIGYQSHFVGINTLKFIEDSLHNAFRIGTIRENIHNIEPVFRDADFVTLNISSIRQSDAPGQILPSPNGFYGEEICQLSRYAGLGNRLSVFGIFDYSSLNDRNNQTAQLIAQIIWYFINGFSSRVPEYPLHNDKNFKKIIVNLDNFKSEIVFYKSEKTQRWWMEVPSFKNKKIKNVFISCTPQDYQIASQGEVPENWLKAYQKIN